VSMDAHMIHTCTVQSATVDQDAYNHDVETWADSNTGQRCRLVIGEERVAFTELAERPVVTTYTLYLPAYVAVAPGQRIVDVTLEDATVEVGPFRIESVLARRGRSQRHIRLNLEKIYVQP
jgi:hypothetical protein